MSPYNLFHYLLLLVAMQNTTHALSAIGCDCSNPTTSGIIDIQDPSYCNTIGNVVERKQNVTYRVLGHQNGRTAWTGYYCSEWLNVKEITGAFWYGVYDTVYKKISKDVSPADCKRIVADYKCAGHQVDRSGNTWTFTKEPIGEGKWNSIVVHSVTNCMAQQITLSATSAAGPIHTPFGTLNTSIYTRSHTIGHNTIIWDPPISFSESTCKEKTLFNGRANFAFTDGHGRLVDKENQLEIHFEPRKKILCDLDVYSVMGIPDTYVHINEPLNRTRREEPSCTMKSASNDPLCISAGRPGQPVFLHRPLSITELRNNRLPPEFSQRFVLLRDYTIRTGESDDCLHIESDTILVLTECNEYSSRWEFKDK